ncbi:MAG TPA: D-alanyl-D-alanine carboxypeptidase/D-alanyl-D-alanine-endopeptidase, partial [Vicinamibacterales bacterium]
MTTRGAAAVLTLALTIGACAPARVPRNGGAPAPQASLASDLDALFSTPPFDTALWSVRIERLQGGDVLYERNPRTLVMPASNMKIVTMAAAAETLGWDYRFETRLVAEGEIRDGVLHGDLRVIGGGDPSIAAQDHGAPALFREWADVLRKAGITRVAGRIIGDDNAFDDETLGAGWAWDYLAFGYAAPVSALQYNEGVVVLRLQPGAKEGDPATLLASPPGHGLDIRSTVRTGAKDSSNGNVDLQRLPGQRTLQVSGTVPLGGRPPVRTTSVDNPTLFFV